MNRNVLKIIAVLSMLIDHIGLFLLKNNLICRCIGRLAFPLFAYFIAEGMRYTRSRKKYVLNLSIFAVITQLPFALLFSWTYINVLFTFLIAIAFIVLIESYEKNTESLKVVLKNVFISSLILFLFILSLFGHLFNLYEYGLYGVILIVVIYFAKSKPLQIIAGVATIALFAIIWILKNPSVTTMLYKLLPLLSMGLLLFYNKEKGKLNLKYLFYIAYPANFLLIYLILLI